MTVIIGAELDDGRRVMYGDGIECLGSAISRFNTKKVVLLETKLKNRKALVGTCGNATAQIIMPDFITKYLNTPAPRIEDLYYRYKNDMVGMGMEEKPEALLWVPDHEEKHVLVHLDKTGYPMVQDERNFHAIGAGAVDATAALLGLALHDIGSLNSATHLGLHLAALKNWRPTIKQLQVAMSVATMSDVYCGGTCELIEL